MPVHLSAPVPSDLHPVAGVRIGVAEAGVRKAHRKDLTVFLLDEGATVGGVFTQNRFCAAPVQVCREFLALHQGQGIRAMVVNTGNANAGTGQDGLQRARATCDALAAQLRVDPTQVLPFSTGVIMEPLPVDRIAAGLPAAIADAQADHWARAAEGIMTTDTVAKAFSTQVHMGAATVSVTGISKGAGMIRPNMATMLGFLATDACVAPALVQQLARDLADQSFNRITIDGVEGGKTGDECRKVAYAIAHSPLVKTAFFASDPNLGRILAAVGYAGIEDLDQTGIDLYLDDVHVAVQGGRNPAYREEDGQRVMQQSEITVRVLLGRGDAAETVWTCDLSHDYVTINADYRS